MNNCKRGGINISNLDEELRLYDLGGKEKARKI
jgi:hypothetical protein